MSAYTEAERLAIEALEVLGAEVDTHAKRVDTHAKRVDTHAKRVATARAALAALIK